MSADPVSRALGACRWALLGLALVASTPTGAAPADGEWAAFVDEVVLPWEARAVVAGRRAEVREAFFAGSVAFEVAFPGFLDVALDRPDVVRGRLLALDAAAVVRAREAARALPADLPPDQAERARTVRASAHAEEDRADALERRLLVGVAARLEEHPSLTAASLAPLRERTAPAASADPDEAARLAAEADADRAALEGLVRTLLVGGAVPDRPIVVDLPDPLDAASADRVTLALPFLDPAAREAAEAALVAWWTGPRRVAAERRLQAAREAPPLVDLDEAEAVALVADLESRVREVADPDPADRLAVARAMVLRVEQEALQIALTRSRAAVDAARATPEAPDAADEVRRAQQEAEEAFEAAEAASRSADDDAGRRRAEVLRARADAQVRAADLWAEANDREESAQRVAEVHQNAVVGLRERIREVRNRRTLDRQGPDADTVYSELRSELNALLAEPAADGQILADAHATAATARAGVREERQRIEDARELLAATPDGERDELARALADWSESLDGELRAAEALVAAAGEERDAVLTALQRVRVERRRLAPWVSSAGREVDARNLLVDMGQELALLRPTITSQVRSRADAALGLPRRLLDVGVLRDLMVGSLWTFALIGLWLWGRALAPQWTRQLVDRLRQWRTAMRPADAAALHDPGTRALLALIDLLLGWSLIGRIGDLVTELGFVLLVYLQVALFRFVLATFDLLVVRPTDFRPAVLVLRDGAWRLARQTVRAAAVYFIARSFVSYVLWGLLGLDRVEGVVSGVFDLVGVGLIGFALWAWAPTIRERVATRVGEDSGRVAWLARADRGHVVRVIRAVGGLGVLGFALASELGDWITRTRLGTSWVVNAFSRYRLQPQEAADAPAPLAPSLVHEVIARPSTNDEMVRREELEARFEATWLRWRSERRQGLVAVCGDRGEGKSTLIRHLVAARSDDAVVVHRSLPFDLRTEEDALRLVAQVAGVEPAPSSDALVAALESIESRMFVLEGLERVYGRTVGGFDALGALLYVINASSDHHFWVVTVHRPAWWFLASVGSMVDVGIFTTVLDLPELTVDELRHLALSRARRAGLTCDFSDLVRSSALGGDPEVARERSERTYFRLLAEVCKGNAHVGLHLFAQSLVPSADDPLRVRVHAGAALSNAVVDGLSDVALFVLVAVRMQEVVGTEELPRVVNLPLGAVRRTLRDLIARGLLERVDAGVRIPTGMLPLVTRTLRRRHFLHLGA